MLAYMNDEALARTIETGEAQFWSRSRKRLWRKGEESGNTMRVVELRTDCDQDALWLKVELGGTEACLPHRAQVLLLSRPALGKGAAASVALIFVETETLFDPEKVYGHASAAKRTLKTQD